jgi:hypothetical protein
LALGKPDSTSQDGVSLQAVIEAARRLDELSCARVVGNIADAVHAAQKGGQPLGTLSPAAIRVLPDGSVKLVAGAAAPQYTAPEKLRGGAVDRRTDVFTLGVVLWEALAHERLFGGANDDAIKQAVLGGEIRPPSELNANVPAELDAICKKALARDPPDRYQSAKVMAAEIDAVLDLAGYPESNEQIARYVAAALASAPAIAPRPLLPAKQPPAIQPLAIQPPGSKTAPRPSVMPGAPGGTLPPPFVASRPTPQTAILGSPSPLAEPLATSQLGSQPLPLIIEPPLKPLPRAMTSPARAARTEILGSLSTLAGHPAPSTAPVASAAPAPVPSTAPAAPSQPPSKPSIANAETIATPQLPAHLAVASAPPQLGMPPGMTVTPATLAAPLQTADDEFQEFEDEHHADPAEVVALHDADQKATGGRDVLAGWGWSTGSVEAIDNDDDVHETARASRKRLGLAIGGALGAVLIVVMVAFAFSGSKQPGEQDAQASAAKPSAAAPVTPPAGLPPEPSTTAPGATNPTPEPPPPAPAALPPPPEPASAEPPSVEPSKVATTEPPAVEPPKAEPPKAELPKAELPKASPKKLDTKRPPEPKKQPSKALKRPPPEKVARTTTKAEPVDPYATAVDKPKADPAAAYKTSLQQYARGDTSGALATLRTSLSSNPKFAPTWRGLGLVYEKLGNHGQARSAFKRYLQLAPRAGDADQIRDRMERLGS